MFQIAKNTLLIVFLSVVFAGCSYKLDIPDGFPTPPQNPPATPLPKITLKPDAELEKQIARIAEEAKGKVGVAAVLLETGDAAMLNADGRFPMQSVYKLPISMAVMEQVRLDKLDLEEKIGVTKEEMVRPGMRSPLCDANPNGGEFTIRELIRLSIVESDGTASDVLMCVAGGPGEIQGFLTQIGIKDWKVVNPEKEIGRDWQTQYENWATPAAAVELLRWLEASVGIGRGSDRLPGADNESSSENALIVQFMAESVPGVMRLKRQLPCGTIVAHKTGTGGTREFISEQLANGMIVDFDGPPKRITSATNDIGIISLPNEKHIAIAVFVSDSPADEKTREAVIAKIAKAVWDRWSK